jgi:hypothetical protein
MSKRPTGHGIRGLLALSLLSAAVPSLSSTVSPVTFTTISQSDQSTIEDKREVTVRTAAEWKKLWQEHLPGQPVPSVDFSKSMVVGVFAGSRATGGYQVAITTIERDGASLVVTWRESQPGRRDIVTQMLTFPHHLVRLERVDGTVKFQKVEK